MKGSVAKFRTIFLKKKAPIHKNNSELIKWCNTFAITGLAPKYGKKSSHGNLSFRNGNAMIVTRSGSDLEKILQQELVEVVACDEKEFVVKANGLFDPSSESFEHFEIYKNRPEINAVFHGHSKEILLNAKKLGIVQTKKEVEFGTVENLNSVMEVLGKNDFIIMRGHGFLCLGKSLDDCGEQALKMQKKATEISELK